MSFIFKLKTKNASLHSMLAASIFTFSLIGCNQTSISQDQSLVATKLHIGDEVCADGLDAFTKNVYKPILRQTCVSCHDNDQDAPPHSSADVLASYTMIKSYVDFAQLEKSRIISRVKSQHWINYDPKATGTTVPIMLSALQSWWDGGEKSCATAATPQSAGVLIPSGLPSFPEERYVNMTWKLDSLGAAFVGSQFSVDVQVFATPTATTPGAYRLRSPRFASVKAGVKIGGVQIYLNKKLQATASSWANMNAEIGGHLTSSKASGEEVFLTAPTLSSRHVILIQDQAAGDMLSVGFTGLQFTPAPQCKSLAQFQSKILPVVQQNSCVICHSPASKNAIGAGNILNFAVPDDVACALTRERADFAHPESSVFLLLGFTEAMNHPPAINLPSSFSKDWVNWVKAEVGL